MLKMAFFYLKENIELPSKNAKTYENGDVLIIDNKEFKEIKFIEI
jgi:ribonuclease R